MWVLEVIVNSARICFTDLENVMLKITKEFFHHGISFCVGQAYAMALECIKTYVESKAWELHLREKNLEADKEFLSVYSALSSGTYNLEPVILT